jgi:hypothetical protein
VVGVSIAAFVVVAVADVGEEVKEDGVVSV